MAKLTVIYWRDIPAQVIVKERRQNAKIQLSSRFEAAIDRSAMRAKKSGADDYIAEWRKSAPVPCDDDMEKAVAKAAREIEEQYTDDRLKGLIKNKGFEAESAE